MNGLNIDEIRKWLLDKEEYQLSGKLTQEERKIVTGVYDYLHAELPYLMDRIDKEFESYHKV